MLPKQLIMIGKTTTGKEMSFPEQGKNEETYRLSRMQLEAIVLQIKREIR